MTRRTTPWLATAPYALMVVALLALPLLGIFDLSLRERSATSLSGAGFTTANYARLAEPYYLNVIWQTLRLALTATLIELVIALPVAYAMARVRASIKAVIGILVMIPLMTSVVVKTFGWYILFGNEGPLAGVWRSLGLPGGSLLGTQFAVLCGMVEFGLPFMIYSLSAAMEKIPPSLEEAAANLGAARWRVWWLVLLPLSRAGMLSGFLLCFGVSASAYVVPALLGGTRIKMAAQLMYDDVLVAFNWPGASAVAMLLLLILLFVLYAAMLLGKGRKP